MSLNEVWLKKRSQRRAELSDAQKDAGAAPATPFADVSGIPAIQGFNEIVRRKLGDISSALRLTMPGSTFHEDRVEANSFLLAPGTYGGATLSKDLSEMRAVAPGARLGRMLNLVGSAVIDGVLLAGADASGCAVVRSTSSVIFRGCTFERPADSVASMVTVEAGGKAVFIGCVFRGSGVSTLPLVAHGGGAASVQIAFCYNATPNPLLFVVGNATGTGNI